jgi:beta-ureidopropionase
MGEGSRIVKASLIQSGPLTENIEQNIEELLKRTDRVGEKERADFVLLGELSYLPYIGAVHDKKYFNWAEPIPGPTTKRFAEKARKYEMCILLGVFEKTENHNIFYNSTVVLGPNGDIIKGIFPDGRKTLRYTKSHIPYHVSERLKYFSRRSSFPPSWGVSITSPQEYRYDETFYFTPGDGWPIFDTPKAKVGVTTCFDRHFPEPYRILALQGAEIIFTPSVAMAFSAERGASMAETYLIELQVRALENSVWLLTVNKAGTESLQGQLTYCYGNSAVIHPTGKILIQGSGDRPEVISYEIDLEDVNMTRRLLPLFPSRKPDLYKLITEK